MAELLAKKADHSRSSGAGRTRATAVRAAVGGEHRGGPAQRGEVGADEPLRGIGFPLGFGEPAPRLGEQAGRRR
jgi:hypothetical protein